MEEKLAEVRELIAQRDDIDRRLAVLFGETPGSEERKPKTCSKCHRVGHTARNCPENISPPALQPTEAQPETTSSS